MDGLGAIGGLLGSGLCVNTRPDGIEEGLGGTGGGAVAHNFVTGNPLPLCTAVVSTVLMASTRGAAEAARVTGAVIVRFFLG